MTSPDTCSASRSMLMSSSRAARRSGNIVDVENPAENLVGIALSASEGAVTAEQLEARPLCGPAKSSRPCQAWSSASTAAKERPTSPSARLQSRSRHRLLTTIAGVPVNTPTGAHAHGYSDISFLIPELVSGVQYKKGPYFADEGDFSAAGAANINYVNRLDDRSLS